MSKERPRTGVFRYFDLVVWSGEATHRRRTELMTFNDRRVVIYIHYVDDDRGLL